VRASVPLYARYGIRSSGGNRTARPVVGRPSILFDTRRNALPRAVPANGPRHRRDRRSSRPLCSSCLERRYLRIVVGSQLEFPAEGSGGLERRESSDSRESRPVRCEATSRSRSFLFKHEDESLRHGAAGVFLAHGIRTQRRGNYTVTKIPARHTQQDNFYPRPPQKSRAQFVRLLLSIARRMRLRKLKRGKALAPAYAPGQKINKGGARAASGRAAPRRCNAPAYPRAPELRARSSRVARIAPAARARARAREAGATPRGVKDPFSSRERDGAGRPRPRHNPRAILDREGNRTHARTRQSSHRRIVGSNASANGERDRMRVVINAGVIDARSLRDESLSVSPEKRTPAKPVSRGVRDAYT